MAVEDVQAKQGPTAGREAIIFIPAIGERTDQSIDGITRRVATALNHHLRADRKFGYSLEDLEHQFGLQSQHKANVRTISEKTSGQEVPIIDVYELNYQEDLTAGFDKRSQFSQMWTLLLVTSMNLWRLVRALGRPGKTLIEKAQIFIGLAIFLSIIAYVVILLWAVIDAGIKGLDKDRQVTVTSEQSAAGESEGQDKQVAELGLIQNIALFLTAAGIFTPSKFKESVRNAATDYVSSIPTNSCPCSSTSLSLTRATLAFTSWLTALVASWRLTLSFHGRTPPAILFQ
jgi:hypothetical protein